MSACAVREPDPSRHAPGSDVCRVGETFYLATSSFEYVPGVPIYRSRNLVDWEPIGHALTQDAQLRLADADASQGIFAPTLRHHDDTFYLTTTNVSEGGHFVVTASDPTGPWSDPVWVDAPGIDPDLFWDDPGAGSESGDGSIGSDRNDATCYFTYFTNDPDRCIEQAEIDLQTGELGPVRTVWSGFEDVYAEAPHLYEREGRYYLVTAEGGTYAGHMVVMARADDPTGPFESHPDNPVLTQQGTTRTEINATGHADLVVDPAGNWWLVCLGVRKIGDVPGYHHLGRETFLYPVEWEDGWPVVACEESSSHVIDAPLPAERDETVTSIARTDTDFADGLGIEWNRRRTRDTDRYETGEDGLTLRGGPERLNERGATFVGRRQTARCCRASADLAFDPESGEEAGLAVFSDENHHYQVGVTREGGERVALARLRIGDATQVVGRRPVDESVTLEVRAGEGSRADYKLLADGERLGTASARYVSTEVAGGFTGVYLGCYATGDGDQCETPARFEQFTYESWGEPAGQGTVHSPQPTTTPHSWEISPSPRS